MAPMPRPRVAHSCGLVQDPMNGPEVIAAGGNFDETRGTVDIYEVNTDSWRRGNTILNKQNFKN